MFDPVVSVSSVHVFGHDNVYSPSLAGVVHFITLSSCRSMANSSEQPPPSPGACHRGGASECSAQRCARHWPLQSLTLGVQAHRMWPRGLCSEARSRSSEGTAAPRRDLPHRVGRPFLPSGIAARPPARMISRLSWVHSRWDGFPWRRIVTPRYGERPSRHWRRPTATPD
jgi:hypothetical protein